LVKDQPDIAALVLLRQAGPRAVLPEGPEVALRSGGDEDADCLDAASVHVQWEQVCVAVYGCGCGKGDLAGQMAGEQRIGDGAAALVVFLVKALGLSRREHERVALWGVPQECGTKKEHITRH